MESGETMLGYRALGAEAVDALREKADRVGLFG